MEYLVIAVILYFILQTAGNLVLLFRGDTEATRPTPSPDHNWQGPSPREQMENGRPSPTFWGDDIEDATYRDL